MRRRRWVLMSLLLIAVAIEGQGPVLANASCAVRNARAGTSYGSLQVAVDAAQDGDALQISGRCVATTTILGRNLRLSGDPTPEQLVPTLDGGGTGRVLVLRRSTIVITDLTMTGGSACCSRRAPRGGGIFQSGGRLVLKGATSITGNLVTTDGGLAFGGGIFNAKGTLVLKGSASVTGNRALRDGFGGGVYNHEGTMIVKGDASVSGNRARCRGGGIANHHGHVRLSDSATVAENLAFVGGGGIYNARRRSRTTMDGAASVAGNVARLRGGGIFGQSHSRIILTGSATVVDNTAGLVGGGIYLSPLRSTVHVCSPSVAIAPNDPDDPPSTLPCP